MAKTNDFKAFLSEEGEIIYDNLLAHCRAKLKMMEVDNFELAMLANSFALYAKSANECNQNGTSIETGENGYRQVSPDYTVMKNEYQNILKHSSKFGLNPGDRAKFFKGLDGGDKKKGFNLK